MTRETLPPNASETATLEAFEAAIRRTGEDNARLAHMTAVFWGLDVDAALDSGEYLSTVSEAA